MHQNGLFALSHNLAKEVLGEPQEHRKVVTARPHMVPGVGHHNVAAEEGIGLVEGRHTVLVGELRIALAEEYRKAVVDTAPEAGCIAAVDKGFEKEHHRVAEAGDSLEVADQEADSPVVGHIQGQAKNRNLAVAGDIGHVAAADNLLNNSQHELERFCSDIRRPTGSTAIRGVPLPTMRGRVRHDLGEGEV